MAVAEAWVATPEATARYVRHDELQQAFNFHWLVAPWSAARFREVITTTLHAVGLVEASPTWVLSNHDVVRHTTRYGGGAVGLARARAAVLAMMALPGSAYLYQGEELGLEQVELEHEHRQDPAYHRGGDEEGRDGCRVPIPWYGDRPPFGFGPGAGQPWLPQPPEWDRLTVEAQEADPDSMLHFYRRLLALRQELAEGLDHEVELLDSAPGSLAFRRGAGPGGLVCLVNCGSRRVRVPEQAGELLLSSGADPVRNTGWTGGDGVRMLEPDTAAWFGVAHAR